MWLGDLSKNHCGKAHGTGSCNTILTVVGYNSSSDQLSSEPHYYMGVEQLPLLFACILHIFSRVYGLLVFQVGSFAPIFPSLFLLVGWSLWYFVIMWIGILVPSTTWYNAVCLILLRIFHILSQGKGFFLFSKEAYSCHSQCVHSKEVAGPGLASWSCGYPGTSFALWQSWNWAQLPDTDPF